MTVMDRARQFKDIHWTDEQKEIIECIFTEMESLMITCQIEKNIEKVNALRESHEIFNGIVTSLGLNKMLGMDREDTHHEH